MNNLSIKLKGGNFAIIQSCGFNENKNITANIGIVLTGTRHLEYLKINDWEATCKGVSEVIKNKLYEVYEANQMIIHKKILAFID